MSNLTDIVYFTAPGCHPIAAELALNLPTNITGGTPMYTIDDLIAKLSEDGNFEYLVEASDQEKKDPSVLKQKLNVDRRLHARFKIQIEVILFNSDHSFRTKTLDISRSGALLMESLPSTFTDNVVDVVLINKKNLPGLPARILLKAVLLGLHESRCRLSFYHSTKSAEYIEKLLN